MTFHIWGVLLCTTVGLFEHDILLGCIGMRKCVDNVRFQERKHHEKFRLDQIQNDLLLANIHFHMAVIW